MSGRSHWRMFFFGLIFFITVFIAGCEQPDPVAPTPEPEKPAPTLVLNIGLIPEQNLFTQKKRYEPLMDYLSQQTGITLKLHILPRYGNLIDNFNKLNLDGAFFGSFTGAMAIKKLGVVPLARPQFIGGRSTYYGMVFVRKDSGIKTAADMKGKRMVFVDRATTAGYLLPLAFFRKLGITNYSDWFKDYYFSGTHEDAILEVLNGYADIGAAKNTIFYRMAATDKGLSEDLEILATSPHVPANGLAVRQDLPGELKKLLQEKLLNMHQNMRGRTILENFGAEKFILTTVGDYQPVFNFAASIGLDLAAYQYLND